MFNENRNPDQIINPNIPGIHVHRSPQSTRRPSPTPEWTPSKQKSVVPDQEYSKPDWIGEKSWAKIVDALNSGDVNEDFMQLLSAPKKKKLKAADFLAAL